MKKCFFILISIISLSLALASCGVTFDGVSGNEEFDNGVYSQNRVVDVDDVDVNIIITYGRPYYYNGYLNYYYYQGLYYYPFYYNDYWYFRPYYHPFRRGYFPVYRDWRPNPRWVGYRGFGRPDRFGRVRRYYDWRYDSRYDYRPYRRYDSRYNYPPRRYDARPNDRNRRFGNEELIIIPHGSANEIRPNGGARSFGGRSSNNIGRPNSTSTPSNNDNSNGSHFGGHR